MLYVSHTKEKAETEFIGISLTVTSQARLGLKVCNKEVNHSLDYLLSWDPSRKKISLLSRDHLKKWVDSHAAAQRTCTLLATANT